MSFQKVSEGIHYELIPVDDSENKSAWAVRILEGDFIETVLRFGNIAYNGEQDCLNFNFVVDTSPAGATEEDVDLQDYAAIILESVLENAIASGSLMMDGDNDD